MIDVVSTSVAVVQVLAPFTPFLTKLGKATADKLTEAIEQHGGDIAWTTAQTLWEKIKARFGDDLEVQAASSMVAAKPEEETYQTTLAKVLAERLGQDQGLAQEFVALLGGKEAVQRVAAGNEAQISNTRQKMTGPGKQLVEGGDRAVITGIDQEMGG